MKNIEDLNLTKCVTNAEVCALISQRVRSISYTELVKHINKSFVFVDDALVAIYTGLLMNKNVYLSGSGGFGKSKLIEAVLNFYKIPHHIIYGHKDLPTDALLGTVDIPKFLENSKYEINFHESTFRVPGVIIGEEFGDISPSTASSLKDILSEKGFRDSRGKIESLISIMIVASNKSPIELSDNESAKALYMSRFPIKVDVSWPDYSKKSYHKLLLLKFPKASKLSLHFMSKLFAENTKSGNLISPRTAIDIMEVYIEKGIKFIKMMDIDFTNINELFEAAKIESTKATETEILDNIEESIVNSIIKNDHTTLSIIYINMEDLKVSADLLSRYTELKSRAREAHIKLTNSANIIQNEFNKKT